MTDKWRDAIVAFGAAQLAAGYEPETVRSRASRLTTMAAKLDFEPDTMTADDVQRWIDAVNVLAIPAASKKAARVAIRAFCRWSSDTGNLKAGLAPIATPNRRIYSADQRWHDAIELFEVAMRAEELADSTIALRRKHVSRFAVETAMAPWDVSFEHYLRWLGILGDTSAPGTVQAHRVSLRAFYQWAHRSGRIFDDPTAEPSQRLTQLHAPEAWETEIAAYRSFLRALGRPESTVQTRVWQMRRFGRDNASLGPWDVTLDDLIDWLSGRRWAPETRRGFRSTLRSFYGWANDSGRCEGNPAIRIPIVKSGQPRPRPALESEYAAALAKSDPRERLALRLAAELGLRRAEVVSIHSRDIIPSDAGWTLRVHGKGDKERTLPLSPALANSLRALPAGWAFAGNYDGHLSPRWMGKLISALLPEGVTMHMLRHRFATRAYNVDRDVFAVQQLLGHASPATTQQYVKIADSTLRTLVEAVGE